MKVQYPPQYRQELYSIIQNRAAMKTAAALLSLAGCVAAHGNLIKIQAQNGIAQKVEGQDGELIRNGQPRGGTTSNGDIPGYPTGGGCDHCVLENRPYIGAGPPNTSPGWWGSRPGAHWDDERVWPEVTPCMSYDVWGSRGVLELVPGEVFNATFYVNADHGGFYRFELAPGREPTNADFMARPISPFYSLHETVETPGHNYPNRVVGWSKNETDLYVDQMVGVGFELGNGRLNQNSVGQSSTHCQTNTADCFLDDRVAVPTNMPAGEYVLRWNWFSLETPQVYTACSDVVIS